VCYTKIEHVQSSVEVCGPPLSFGSQFQFQRWRRKGHECGWLLTSSSEGNLAAADTHIPAEEETLSEADNLLEDSRSHKLLEKDKAELDSPGVDSLGLDSLGWDSLELDRLAELDSPELDSLGWDTLGLDSPELDSLELEVGL